MGNDAFAVLTVTVLALHVGALALAMTHRGGPAVPGLACAVAAAVLVWMGLHPRPFKPPIDALVVGLAAFEAIVLIAAAMALRGAPLARRIAWLGFGFNAAVSALAVAVAFLFRMDRLF